MRAWYFALALGATLTFLYAVDATPERGPCVPLVADHFDPVTSEWRDAADRPVTNAPHQTALPRCLP